MALSQSKIAAAIVKLYSRLKLNLCGGYQVWHLVLASQKSAAALLWQLELLGGQASSLVYRSLKKVKAASQ